MESLAQIFCIILAAAFIIAGVVFNLVILYYLFIYFVLPCAVIAIIIWIVKECIRQWSQPS